MKRLTSTIFPLKKISKGIVFALFFLSLANSGCALFGGGGNELPRAKDYQVTPSAQWSPANDSGESDKAYRLSSGSLVTLTSSCNRFAQSSPELLTKHVLMGTRNVKTSQKQKITIDEWEGLHSSVTATLEGVPFHLEIIVVSFGNCVFDFQLINPKTIPQKDQLEFISFAKSLSHRKN